MDTLERIRTYMQVRNWTEYRLAKESGLSQPTIANMFSRHTAPSVPTLEAICKGFGTTLSRSFSENNGPAELSADQIAMSPKWARLIHEQELLIAALIDDMGWGPVGTLGCSGPAGGQRAAIGPLAGAKRKIPAVYCNSSHLVL